MKKYFINPDDGKLRAGWRILAFLILFMGISMVVQMALKARLGGIPKTTCVILPQS